jgi:hypothetical protein
MHSTGSRKADSLPRTAMNLTYQDFQAALKPRSNRKQVSNLKSLERAVGIEPTSEAWKAPVLPLYDARSRPPARLYRLATHFMVERYALLFHY